MKKILFTGGKGLLGKYFLRNISKDYFVFATYLLNKEHKSIHRNIKYVKLDILNKSSVIKVLNDYRPEIIVHAASLGNVDYCEQHKSKAWNINVGGTINVAEESRKIKASMVYLSSSVIFDGVHPPFSEKSSANPLDYYGKTKLEAEKEVTKRHPDNVIVRLTTMYGWNNKNERLNPVSWTIQQLMRGKETKVVNDIYNSYLYAGDASSILWKIILKNKAKEIYHVSGPECISRFDLALKVAKIFHLDTKLLIPVPSDYFVNIAPRPKNTCFDIKKIQTSLHVQPVDVLSGLRLMKNEKN